MHEYMHIVYLLGVYLWQSGQLCECMNQHQVGNQSWLYWTQTENQYLLQHQILCLSYASCNTIRNMNITTPTMHIQDGHTCRQNQAFYSSTMTQHRVCQFLPLFFHAYGQSSEWTHEYNKLADSKWKTIFDTISALCNKKISCIYYGWQIMMMMTVKLFFSSTNATQSVWISHQNTHSWNWL